MFPVGPATDVTAERSGRRQIGAAARAMIWSTTPTAQEAIVNTDFEIYWFNPQPHPPAITNLRNGPGPQAGDHGSKIQDVIVTSYRVGGA